MSKHQQAIDVLLKAKEDIKKILTDDIDQNHALRIDSEFQKIINTFSLTTGQGGFVSEPAKVPGPATTFLGEELVKETITSPEAVKPSAEAVAELKIKIEEHWKTFPDTDSVQILNDVDETIIRGVARKAGVKGVTKDNPKEITTAFIDQVKETITKSAANK